MNTTFIPSKRAKGVNSAGPVSYTHLNVRNYLKRRMHFELLGNVPVLSIRCEPLESLENRIIKRAFDVVCSGLFLITVFPWLEEYHIAH